MINSINIALKALLKLDPQAHIMLKDLEGKYVSVHFTDLDKTITLNVKDGSIYATNETPDKNILSGTLAYIIELVMNKNIQTLLMEDKLEYTGSLSDLNKFHSFIESIDIDIIYKISEKTSPEFAHMIEVPFHKAKEYFKNSRKETFIDIKEYLTEEKKILISKNEVNIFYREVNKLRQAADRIEAKIKLLEGSYND